jgi:hypothetical protein
VRAAFAVSILICTGCEFAPAAVDGIDGDGGRDRGDAAAAPLDAGSADATVPWWCDPGDPDLVACWRFEGIPDVTQLFDLSGEGNHGVVNGAGSTAGVVGEAVEILPFTQILVPDSQSLDAVGALTIDAWVKLHSTPAVRGGVVDANGQYGLFVYAGGQVRCLGGGATAVASAPLVLEEWTHLACVFDGSASTMTVYVDRASASAPGTNQLATTGTDGIVIGADSACPTAPCRDVLDGAIDELRIWRRALTLDEIETP